MSAIILSLKKSLAIGLFLSFLSSIYGQGSQYIYNGGTNWVSDFYDVITEGDPSAFQSIQSQPDRPVLMWDRDANNSNGAWITPLAYVYQLRYDDSITAEIRLRKADFDLQDANRLATKYGRMMGQLPAFLRTGVDSINILASDALFGGNSFLHSIEITIGATSELYEQTGNLEETLIHEATHAALDHLYRVNADWTDARDLDPRFISRYAADNPDREDIAETVVPFLGLRYQNQRIEVSNQQNLQSFIPGRLDFLDSMKLNPYPMGAQTSLTSPSWKPQVRIFPNPSSTGIFQLEIDDLQADKLEIFASDGQLILDLSPNTRQINLAKHPIGNYFLRVQKGQETTSYPIQRSR